MKKQLVALAAALGLSACTLLPPTVTPVVPASTSVAQANARLERVAKERAAIEAQYAASEAVCYRKFFVNNCLDDAKEKRRVALAYQAAVEDEAEYFRRKAAVEERDREVAQAIRQFELDEARAAAQSAPAPRPQVKAPAVMPKPSMSPRRATREEREAQRAAQEQAMAPQRAANAKAFEERRLKVEERKREVAEKLAAKKAKAEAEER